MYLSKLTAKRATLDSCLYFLPILWLASIPLGPSIEGIFFSLTLISLMFKPECKSIFIQSSQETWYRLLMLLAFWTLISALWTPVFDHEAWFNIKKVLRFLCIPLLSLGFRQEGQKQAALKAFVWAALLPCTISMIKFFYTIDWHESSDPGHVFYNHILTGFIASFAAYLCLEFYLKKQGYIFLMLWAIFSIQTLLINPGRAAYALYACLMLYILWFRLAKHIRILSLGLALILMLSVLSLSPSIQNGIHRLVQDIQEFQAGHKATSLGFRIQFHYFAFSLFKNHYWIGNGPGAFVYWFKTLNPVPTWTLAPNSHSQYWLILSEEGLIGFALWLSFILAMAKKAMQEQPYGRYFVALLSILALNSLSDNAFFFAPGYLFLALAAMALYKTKAA